MSKIYKTPGVYIHELPMFTPSVAPVETAIPVFIGRTEFVKDTLMNLATPVPGDELKAIKINSFAAFQQYFGSAYSEDKIFNVQLNENGRFKFPENITVLADKTKFSGFYMFYTLQMFFANGGGPCYILSTGDFSKTFDDVDGEAALKALSKVDDVTIIVFTDKHADKTEQTSGYAKLYNATLNLCAELKDRVAIFDSWIFTGSPTGDAGLIRKEFQKSNLKYGAIYYPWLSTSLNYGIDESKLLISHKISHLAGTFDGKTLFDVGSVDQEIYNRIKAEIAKVTVDVPPSGAVAGAIATVDSTRGVWKAPVNISINAVIKPTVELLSAEADVLNIDSTEGKSINSIRKFTGKGILIWGARTLDGNDNEWRYLSITRFFNFVEESLQKSVDQFIFEPNDANTWMKVKAMCENFLFVLWRQGALQGIKPDQACYVNIGLNSTMTALDITEGRMILEIGMAAVRPAEFIIMRLTFKMAST